jgi:hypothetical protein
MKNALTIRGALHSLEGCRKLAGDNIPGRPVPKRPRPGRGDGNPPTLYNSNQIQTDSGRKISVFICPPRRSFAKTGAHLWLPFSAPDATATSLPKAIEGYPSLLKGKIKNPFLCVPASHSTELTESAESSFGSVHFVQSVKNRFPFPLPRVASALPVFPLQQRNHQPPTNPMPAFASHCQLPTRWGGPASHDHDR